MLLQKPPCLLCIDWCGKKKSTQLTIVSLCGFFFKGLLLQYLFRQAYGVHVNSTYRTYLPSLAFSPFAAKQGRGVFGDPALFCFHPPAYFLLVQQSNRHGPICPGISAPGPDYLFVWPHALVLFPELASRQAGAGLGAPTPPDPCAIAIDQYDSLLQRAFCRKNSVLGTGPG